MRLPLGINAAGVLPTVLANCSLGCRCCEASSAAPGGLLGGSSSILSYLRITLTSQDDKNNKNIGGNAEKKWGKKGFRLHILDRLQLDITISCYLITVIHRYPHYQ